MNTPRDFRYAAVFRRPQFLAAIGIALALLATIVAGCSGRRDEVSTRFTVDQVELFRDFNWLRLAEEGDSPETKKQQYAIYPRLRRSDDAALKKAVVIWEQLVTSRAILKRMINVQVKNVQADLPGGALPVPADAILGGDSSRITHDIETGSHGAETPQIMADYWAFVLHFLEDSAKFDEEVREIAHQNPPRRALPQNPIAVRLTPELGATGLIEIENKSGVPLRNCLMLTHLTMDRQRIEENARKNGLGQFRGSVSRTNLLAVESTFKSGQLSTQIDAADRGILTYFPAMKPGEIVRVPFCRPEALAMATKLDVSLWCDEASVEGLDVPGLPEVRSYLGTRK